jgi:hypothetical protein
MAAVAVSASGQIPSNVYNGIIAHVSTTAKHTACGRAETAAPTFGGYVPRSSDCKAVVNRQVRAGHVPRLVAGQE